MEIKTKNIRIKLENNLINSIVFMGEEILNTTKIWPKKFPILWPAIGINKTFKVNNKNYNIPKHGYWNDLNFKKKNTDNSIMLYTTNTNNIYPFHIKIEQYIYFENENKINITTTFTGDNVPMQFGYHPAFKNETNKIKINSGSINILKNGKIEKKKVNIKSLLDINWGKIDTLITKQNRFKLENKNYNLIINSNLPYTAIWTNGDKYICIEPWSNLPAIYKKDHNSIVNETIYTMTIELIENNMLYSK